MKIFIMTVFEMLEELNLIEFRYQIRDKKIDNAYFFISHFLVH